MATHIRRVQSQEIINVSQGSLSDPIPQSESPRLRSPPATGNDQTEERIQESLTDDLQGNNSPEAQPTGIARASVVGGPVASRRDGSSQRVKGAASSSKKSFVSNRRSSQPPPDIYAQDTGDSDREDSRGTSIKAAQPALASHSNTRLLGDTQVPGTRLYSSATAARDTVEAVPAAVIEDHDEEDLYEATPERKTHTSPPKPHERHIASTISLGVASLFPAAKVSEVDTSASQSAPPQSTFRQPGRIINEKGAASKSISRIGSATPQPAAMASGNAAAPSTGKLKQGALARLKERRETNLGRSGEASAKVFENAAEKASSKASGSRARKNDSPAKPAARAPKAKDKMKNSTTQAETPRDSVNGNLKAHAPPQKPHPPTAARKRKAEPETVAAGSKAATASMITNKRAKRNKPASPEKSRQSSVATPGSYRPEDPYDFPDSAEKIVQNKVAKMVAKEAVRAAITTGPVVKMDEPASKKTVAANNGLSRKVGSAKDERESRQLRSKNPKHQLPIDSDEYDNDEDGGDSIHDEEGEEVIPPAKQLAPQDGDDTQIDHESGLPSKDQPIRETKIKLECAPPVASIEPVATTSEQVKPVGSQFNAIVLSDHSDSELSSSIDQDSPPGDTLPIPPKKPATRPQTPAPIASSPPRAFSRAGSQSLRGTGRSRKTQIISFDKNGARNQGSVPKSWNARASIPPLNVAVNWGSSTSKPTDMSRKKASSVATSIRSGKSNLAAPPSNVALDVYDALAGLSKKAPPAASSTTITVNTAHVPAPDLEQGDVSLMGQYKTDYEDHDSGFNTINDMDKFVNSPSPGQQLNAELEQMPTASQTAMPPPPKHKAQPPWKVPESGSNQRVVASEPPLEVSPATHPRTRAAASQAALKAPSMPLNPLVAVPSSAAITKSNGKRPIPREASRERPLKRANTTSAEGIPDEANTGRIAKATMEQPSEKVKAAAERYNAARSKGMSAETPAVHGSNTFMHRPTVPMMATSSKDIPPEPQPKLQPKPKPAMKDARSKTSVGFHEKPAQPEPSKQARRKQSRHLSQNSQTVDINGSPVPHDMEVTESSTVLETFSQQADESSGAAQDSMERSKTPMENATSAEDAFSVPPSHQQPSMSSNTKPVPGPSGASSKTMRLMTKVETERLTSKQRPTAAASDPFASSGESQGVAVQAKHKEPLLGRTLNFAQDIGDTGRSAAIDLTNDGDTTDASAENPTPEQKTTKTAASPTASPDFATKFASKLDRQVAAFREHTAFTRAPEEEDPDKTLVNECSQETQVSKGMPCDSSADVSANGTPEYVSERDYSSESSGEDVDNLRSWRKGLKPHQVDLYDELKKIARFVTGYVVDQEGSTEFMIDENYRRELVMVEQEEEVQKVQYKQYLAKLQQKKKDKIREMEGLEKTLQGVLEASASSWEEHCRGRAEKDRANREVEGLLAGFP